MGVTFVTGVADSCFRELIAGLEREALDGRYVLATREDNALALAAGAALAGERPLVFMESSGLGNSIDALTSLLTVYRLPVVLLIAWAGYAGRDVPHHNSIGIPLEAILTALAIPFATVRFADPFATTAAAVAEAAERARRERRTVAVLGIPKGLEGE